VLMVKMITPDRSPGRLGRDLVGNAEDDTLDVN